MKAMLDEELETNVLYLPLLLEFQLQQLGVALISATRRCIRFTLNTA